MKKKLISLFIAAVIAVSAAVPSLHAAAADINYGEYITNPIETTVIIDGLTKAYRFVQIADSHVVIISSDSSSYYYAESLTRFNQFAGLPLSASNPIYDPTSNGKPAFETLNAMYQWANEPENDIDCVWLTGDNIDFPSSENVSFITNLVDSGTVDHMYCFGNHDWTYPAKYFTTEARNSFRPMLTSAMGGNNLVAMRDYGEFVVVMIDNSENYINYGSVANFIRNTVVPLNKPTILLCHVPFYNPELLAYSKSVWGTDETMANPNQSKYTYTAATKYVYEWATTDPNVKALFTGHFHTTIDAPIAGGAMQYNTAAGYQGTMRIVTVRGTSCAVHTWVNDEVYTAPTTKPGTGHYTCSVCGEEKEDEIPAIYVGGDIDNDGKVSLMDALSIRMFLTRQIEFENEQQLCCADANGDGKINTKDSLYVRKYLAGYLNNN